MPNLLVYRHCREGISLLEAIVVIVILILLAGMLLPSATICVAKSHKTHCASNQRQIVIAMMEYAEEHQGRWPVRLSNSGGQRVDISDPLLDGTATAIASLEYLTDQRNGELSPKLFICPDGLLAMPSSPANLFTDPKATSAWVPAGPKRLAYSYDWSAPTNSTSSRVIMADRDVKAHRGPVIVVFADGHSGTVNNKNGAFINLDAAKDDDIYTDVGDGPMGVPGGGSATRTFVR